MPETGIQFVFTGGKAANSWSAKKPLHKRNLEDFYMDNEMNLCYYPQDLVDFYHPFDFKQTFLLDLAHQMTFVDQDILGQLVEYSLITETLPHGLNCTSIVCVICLAL